MTRKSKKPTLDEVLRAPDRMEGYTYGLNGILASLFRRILADKQIGHVRWAQCMERYLRDPRNMVGTSTKERTQVRGNVAKELLNDQMTWKVFLKGLVFLQQPQAEFSVKLTDHLGRSTVHSIPVNFGLENIQDAPQSEEDDEERAIEKGPVHGPGPTSESGGGHD